MRNNRNLPKLKGMSLRLFFAACSLFSLLSLGVVIAQGIDSAGDAPEGTLPPLSTPSGVTPHYYLSVPGSGLGIPSGVLGMDVNSASTPFPKGVPTNAVSADDVANLQGCGGIGQGDYTSALYNMPEVFDKFKRDVNSELAKQILTYNYSLPQTAALFDTLNAYGNARYQQFQQSCKLDALKEDAKKQYMTICVKEQLPVRKKVVTDALNNAKQAMQNTQTQQQTSSNNKTVSAPNAIKDVASQEQVDAQAYAQAWEICDGQYAADTKSLALRKDSNTKFINTLRGSENVNEAIKGLVCTVSGSTVTNTDAQGNPTTTATGNDDPVKSCWVNLFLPQVRICNGDDLYNGCTPASTYGVKEPPLSIGAYFDLLRFVMANGVVSSTADVFTTELKKNRIPPSVQKMAAGKTILSLAKIKTGQVASTDPTTMAFQLGYLSCRSNDVGYTLNKYRLLINTMNASLYGSTEKTDNTVSNTMTTNQNFTASDAETYINKYTAIPQGLEEERKELANVTLAALGCTINQTIPIFDPNITYSVNNECGPDERNAYYTMASYDVAMASTRDVYRFISLRLKQAYSRLLSEKGAGISQTVIDSEGKSSTAAVTIDSPEIRERLARAIKEIMLPAVETQLQRLNEIEAARGTFGRRIEQIYANKGGCMFGTPDSSPPDIMGDYTLPLVY